MVDVTTAEAMVNEALCMVAEAEAVVASLVNVAEVAERRVSQLECALCDAQAQLDQARQQNDCEKAAREAAELRAEDWQSLWKAAAERAWLRVGRACR
eukprot:1738326-Prymnesium_polylepis.1